MPPGGGPPAHIHRDEAETFYVLEGEIEFLLGERIITATGGDNVNVPCGTVHRFHNAGSARARLILTFRFVFGGHLLCQDGEPGEPGYAPSRPFLEAHVRRRVRALGNVTVRDRCEVAGLAATPAGDRVTRTRVLPAGGADEILAACLVVDATGRGGRTLAWLTALGYDPPAEERVPVDVKYASRYLRLPAGALGAEKLVIISFVPLLSRPRLMKHALAAGRSAPSPWPVSAK